MWDELLKVWKTGLLAMQDGVFSAYGTLGISVDMEVYGVSP